MSLYVIRRVLWIALAARVSICFLVGISALPTLADTITATRNAIPTVTEGDAAVVTFTVVVTVDPTSPPTTLSQSFGFGNIGPDTSDGITGDVVTLFDTCLGTFAPGTTSTCTVQTAFGTPTDRQPEADTDLGHVIFITQFFDSNGAQSNRPNGGFTVVDAPAVVPEPSSLTLLGTGAWLVAFFRRRGK